MQDNAVSTYVAAMIAAVAQAVGLYLNMSGAIVSFKGYGRHSLCRVAMEERSEMIAWKAAISMRPINYFAADLFRRRTRNCALAWDQQPRNGSRLLKIEFQCLAGREAALLHRQYTTRNCTEEHRHEPCQRVLNSSSSEYRTCTRSSKYILAEIKWLPEAVN